MRSRASHRSSHSLETVDLVVLLGRGQRNSYSRRSIRGAVGVLVRGGWPFGSTVNETYEHFIISTEEQLQRVVANYTARTRQIEKAMLDAFRHGPRQPGL